VPLRSILVFLCLLLPCGFAQAEVAFSGVAPEDQKALERKLPDLKSDHPSLSTLDDAIRELMKLDSYQNASVVETGLGQYRITALILKRIGEIVVAGEHEMSKDDILAAFQLKSGSTFEVGHLQDAGERVKELYGKHGYFNTIVSFDFQDMDHNDVRILMNVRERQPCLIKGVNFTSENPALNVKLQSLAAKKIGKPFTEDTTLDLEGNINSYLKDHRYLNSQLLQKDAVYNAARTEVVLTYDLTDPYTYELFISGTTAYTDREIIRNLKLDNFAKGSRDPGLDITNAIRAFYIKNGFPNVKVNFQEKLIAGTDIKRLLIDINEGSQVRISNIEILGRISRPAKYYAEFIRTHSSEIVEKGFYVKEDLDNGIKNLVTDLNNQGFLHAKAQTGRAEYNEKKTEVIVVVNLDEGPLTQLSKVSFNGVKAFSSDQILKVLPMQPNSPLRLNQLEESIGILKKYYYDRGFLEMKLLNENDSVIEYDEKGVAAVVHFNIEEGPQIFVRAIEIEGLQFTKEYFVRRRISVEVGDLLTPEVIDENRRILEKTTIFSRVEIHTREANTNISQRTLVINVTERNPGLFKVGAGLTNKNRITVRGRGGISYNNIMGTGRAVSLFTTLQENLVNHNWLEYEVDVGYKEPFLFNSKWLGRADYSHSEYLLDIDNTQLLATNRITFSAERDINSRIKFTWLTWGLDSDTQYLVPDNGPSTRESRIEVAYIGPIIDIDYSDNRFLPTKGNYARFEALYSDPAYGSSKEVQFFRTEGTFSHYTQLHGPRLVWANSVRGGYERNLNSLDGSAIPLSYAFFLGGYTTVRGYSGTGNDRIPNGNEFPVSTSTINQLIVPTYSDYFLIKSEIRYPIVDPVGGVIFYDAGQVDIGGQTFYNPYRQSVGLGLRINTPVGPLSLDYGRKLNQQPGEGPDAWHLFIGTF